MAVARLIMILSLKFYSKRSTVHVFLTVFMQFKILFQQRWSVEIVQYAAKIANEAQRHYLKESMVNSATDVPIDKEFESIISTCCYVNHYYPTKVVLAAVTGLCRVNKRG
jgi:hypothetical protein